MMADRTAPACLARRGTTLALIGLLLTGCTGRTPAAAPVATAATTNANTPTGCAALPDGTPTWLPMADDGRLAAVTAGTGNAAAVFLHEIGRQEGMCGFAPYAAWLVAHSHVLVVLVNRCGYRDTQCVSPDDQHDIAAQTAPAVTWAHNHGATTVTLVGASGGGLDAIDAGALVPGVDAVVDISGDVNDTGADDHALAARLTVPTLVAVAPNDPFCPIDKVQSLYAAVGAGRKQLSIQDTNPGRHGWDLLLDGDTPLPLATTVADWITAAGPS
jgi:dienelactone hydrolase